MSRRRAGAFDDLVGIAAKLPWWGGLILAAASYFLIHPFSGPVTPQAIQPGNISNVIVPQLVSTMADVAQYAVPFAFLIGSIVSGFGSVKNRKVFDSVKSNASSSALQNLSWRDFERFVSEAFRRLGFSVHDTPTGADGGVDLELRKSGELYLVQCKRWRAFKVGVEIVRELYGVMAARGAAGGFVVTSGVFTDEAKKFANGRNIELWDGVKLNGMPRATLGPTQAVSAVKRQEPVISPRRDSILACPTCGATMIRRTARRGGRAGKDFWGCSTYPKCKGTLAAS